MVWILWLLCSVFVTCCIYCICEISTILLNNENSSWTYHHYFSLCVWNECLPCSYLRGFACLRLCKQCRNAENRCPQHAGPCQPLYNILVTFKSIISTIHFKPRLNYKIANILNDVYSCASSFPHQFELTWIIIVRLSILFLSYAHLEVLCVSI